MKRKPPAKPASTKITLTLPNDLLAVLDAACAQDNRTRSNFITYSLRRLQGATPCLGEPRSKPTHALTQQCINELPQPCPRGHIRPCDRK